ncbi:uracil-DNA glycosylase, partial [Jimgerdemannia flammicorona]
MQYLSSFDALVWSLQLKRFLKKEKERGQKVFPPENQIYSWSNFTPFSNVKVIILGQDPYHSDGQAHGLCFSVPTGVRPPPSLVNIYDAIKRDIPDFEKPAHGYVMPSESGYLEAWAKEGVLLLNTSLTVRAHTAASHSGKGWEMFT